MIVAVVEMKRNVDGGGKEERTVVEGEEREEEMKRNVDGGGREERTVVEGEEE